MTRVLASLPLLRLLQLASPSLPVGSFAYSQGLEAAVDRGWVASAQALDRWLAEQLEHGLGRVDLPVLARLYDAAQRDDEAARLRWSRRLLAMRETRELVADDCDRGRALARVLCQLEVPGADDWIRRPDLPFAAPFALAALHWRIPLSSAAQAYAFAWLENQVLAGVKLIPLGQSAAQNLLFRRAALIPEVCERALARDDDSIGGTLAALALASSLHETQYSRLFRS